MQPCRVCEEGLRVVKHFRRGGKKMTLPSEEAPANSVPAAAVIRRMRALSGFIGFKGCVGGDLSQR